MISLSNVLDTHGGCSDSGQAACLFVEFDGKRNPGADASGSVVVYWDKIQKTAWVTSYPPYKINSAIKLKE